MLSVALYGFIAVGSRTYVTVGNSGGHASGVCHECVSVGGTQPCTEYCARDTSDYSAPDDLLPYAHGDLRLPFVANNLGGGAYDEATGTLYLSARGADQEQSIYGSVPVIVVVRVSR